jgi:hypothetical protein
VVALAETKKSLGAIKKPPVETKVNLDRRQLILDQVEITRGLLSE